MDMGLKGRTVLVTGASNNLGRAVALAFARERANVAICALEDTRGLEETSRLIEQVGGSVVACLVDITDGHQVSEYVESISQTFGPVEIVVNSAVHRAEASIDDFNIKEWQRAFLVTEIGAANVCQATIPAMKRQGWGRIVSYSGIGAFLGHGVIRASVKLGIVGFTRAIAAELGPYGITANCIAPGVLDTNRAASLSAQCIKDEGRRSIKRRGSVQDVAAFTVFLTSQYSGYINGQCMLIDGGAYNS